MTAPAAAGPIYFYPPPKHCDVCGRPLVSVMYDARHWSGAWACMCPTCWQASNSPLGLGRGQKYERQPDRRWLKTA